MEKVITKRVPKILFIHNTLPEYRIQFFSELSNMVHLVVLITDTQLASSIYKLETEIPKSINVININNVSQIHKIIVNEHWDSVVLPPLDTSYQVLCASITLISSKIKGYKTLYWTEKWEAEPHLQPFYKKIKNKIQSFIIGFFARHVDLCIAAGTRSKKYFNTIGVNKSNIRIAYDSSTSPITCKELNIREIYNIPKDGKIVLFFSRVIKRKGCDLLIKAFQLLNNPKVYLCICGEGDYLLSVKKYVDDLNINNVVFCGKVQPKDRAIYLSQSDVFVLPSYTYRGVIEAWGLTCNEALEQGTAVLATSAVGAAYDLADGKCCLMVAENDINALENGLKILLSRKRNEFLCKERYRLFSVRNMAYSFYEAFIQ